MAVAHKQRFVPQPAGDGKQSSVLWQRVRAKLLMGGYTPAKIARLFGLSNSFISNLLRGHDRTPRHQQRIARLVDIHPQDLFEEACHKSLRRRAGERA